MMSLKRSIIVVLIVCSFISPATATKGKSQARPAVGRISKVKHVFKKHLGRVSLGAHRHPFRTVATYAGTGAVLGSFFGPIGTGAGFSVGAITGLSVSGIRYLMTRGSPLQGDVYLGNSSERTPAFPVLTSATATMTSLTGPVSAATTCFTVPEREEAYKVIVDAPVSTVVSAPCDTLTTLIRSVIQILATQGRSDGSRVSILTKKCAPHGHNFILGDIHGTPTSLEIDLLDLERQVDSLTHLPYVRIQRSGSGVPNFLDITINNPATNLVFLGDNGDRGPVSIDVWKILLTLKAKYPCQVFLLRGNHETTGIASMYGLLGEWTRKFGSGPESLATWALLQDLFNRLPQALFLSTRMIDGNWQVFQCCHGGMGLNKVPGLAQYTPLALNFLDFALNRPELNTVNMVSFHLPLSWSHPEDQNNVCGFLWGDFGQEVRHIGESVIRQHAEPSYCGRFFSHNFDAWATYAKRTGWIDPKPVNINLVGMARGHEHHQHGVTCNGVAMTSGVTFPVDPTVVPVFTVMSSALTELSNAYSDLYSNGTNWLLRPHIIPVR